ncbi:NADH dehydrogenase [ubiquinone] 1 alpha subcomplex assembly factor 3 [Brachionus plicatilis]|uniref:NADH dehydrogenase [ubiquinone] 1 alpha subcomplex assembly factor 3 n=1 Tax=Brachionus plicatilis TaxID=10195 RepID=A0A3M7RJT3_BRAPC|nr:NADH dehydrogenase [ubiquinone] 1 alpha subcomplex assembly factor 3 [Brachionus plicatilis]
MMSSKILNSVKSALSTSNLKKCRILRPSTLFPITWRNQGDLTGTSYTKTSIQKFSPEEGIPLQITSYNENGFTLNQNIRVFGPMIIFPKTIYSWNIADIDEINEKSLLLFKMLDPKIDVLVIGTGDKYSKINPSVPKWLIQNKLNNFEILPTEKAINVFNFLLAENRFVAGAFLPSAVIREVDLSVKRVFEAASLYREIEDESEKAEKTKIEDKNTKKITDEK